MTPRRSAALLAAVALLAALALRSGGDRVDGPVRESRAADPEAGTPTALSAPALSAAVPASPARLPVRAAPIASVPGRSGELAMRDGAVSAVFTPSGFSIRAMDPARGLGWTAAWSLEGARAVEPRPEGELAGKLNRLVGPRSAWSIGESTWSAVRYPEVREGVDLVVEARPKGLEYSFHAAAGADASSFPMRWDGATSVRVSDSGDAVDIVTGLGTIRESELLAYQDLPEGRREVPARYRSTGPTGYAIDLGAYDVSRPVVIDPTVSWATYVGGAFQSAPSAAHDAGRAVAVDAAGNVYVTGTAGSTDMATPGAWDRFNAQSVEGFVSKLKTDGTAVLWTTYVGSCAPGAVAVDPSGYVIVTGFTSGNDFPVVGGFQPVFGGSEDAFVIKVTPDGSNVWFSSFLGGNGGDHGNAVTTDASGAIYVAGVTYSFTFPVVGGGLDSGFDHLGQAFVAKIDASGTLIHWSSRIGGSAYDSARGVAVDASGVVLSGLTQSANFPTTPGAFDATLGGDSDAFLLRLPTSGAALSWSTYLGGSGMEEADEVALDSLGNVYTVGMTASSDFPTKNPFQATAKGWQDAYVVKMNALGTALVWSSYLGGFGGEGATGVAIDSNRAVLVTGYTSSTDFPVVNGFKTQSSGLGEGFVAKVRANGTGLAWSSYVGSWGNDWSADVAVDAANNVYLTGETDSTDLATASAFDTTLGGAQDAFVLKTSPGGVLRWISYLGGDKTHGFEQIRAVAADLNGAVFVVGDTTSVDYPATPGAFQTQLSEDPGTPLRRDAVLSRYLPDGSLHWSTYLGGLGDETARAVVVDNTSSVYVAGVTESWDFPTTPGALRTETDGHDIFVVKIDSLGTQLLWSTLFGGVTGFDVPNAIALDGSKNVILAGQAGSGDFPVKAAYDLTFNGWTDAFVSKISASGATLMWSTVLGGFLHDQVHGLAVDAAGAVYAVGETQSLEFPASGWDVVHNGDADAFALKLSANGKQLKYSTFLGGPGADFARAVAVDSSGVVVITGQAGAPGFPTTASAFDTTFSGSIDGFVAKVNAAGTSLVWSSFLGGDQGDFPSGIAIDGQKNVYVTGYTTSANFPHVNGWDDVRNGFSDAFVIKILSSGQGVAWSSLFGGSGQEDAAGLTVLPSGHVYLAGNTDSPDLATSGAADPLLGGIFDGFVTRIAP